MARLLGAGVFTLSVLLSLWHADAAVTQNPVPAAAAKVVAKPVVTLPTLEVKCQAINDIPPFRVVNCKLVSRLQVPVCVRFACTPPPGNACPGLQATGAVSNKACAWAVNADCSIPTPVYPSRGNKYGFGWMTTEQGPVSVTIASFTRVGFRTVACP